MLFWVDSMREKWNKTLENEKAPIYIVPLKLSAVENCFPGASRYRVGTAQGLL